jgi:hypothetical protein
MTPELRRPRMPRLGPVWPAPPVPTNEGLCDHRAKRPSIRRCGPGARWGRPPRADPRRRGREPEPVGGERRAPRHRQGVRRLADGAEPDRRRLLAGAGGIGPVPRRHRRPLRPQADVPRRRGAVGARLPDRRLRAEHRRADRGAHPRWRVGRHGLSHDAGAGHRAVGAGTGPDQVDRPVVRPRRCDRRARAAGRGWAPRALLVGLGLPRDPAPRRRRLRARPDADPCPRQRGRRAGRQPGRRPVGGGGGGPDS